MRNIRLLAMELEHFRSFNATTIVEFSLGAGLKFLSGNNKAQPRLGANGAGKSTLWDALAWCLTGASVKGVRASNLVSWGAKVPRVQVALEIGGELALVERHGNPDRLTVDDKPVDQLTVDRLLGLSRVRFLQSVVFGQGVPLFIDLSGPERGALLDEVLDLGVWLQAADAAATDHGAHNATLAGIAKDIAYITGKLDGLPDPYSLDAEIEAWNKDLDARIAAHIDEVEAAEKALRIAKRKVTDTKLAVTKLGGMDDLEKQLTLNERGLVQREEEYKRFYKELQDANKLVTFYQHNSNCPECSQAIPKQYSLERVKRFRTIASDAQSRITGNGGQQRVLQDVINRVRAEVQKHTRKREFLLEQRATALAEYNSQERLVDAMAAAAERMFDAKNPHEERKASIEKEWLDTQNELNALNATRTETETMLERADFWRAAFKRVRLFLVKRVLAQLDLETAAAAIALGLVGWEITFSTELETKSGTLRPGIHIMVKEPGGQGAPWEAWSGGEAQRVRLAVALGLASLIQRMAGVCISFEIWDEPTQYLSGEGIEDLLVALRHRADTTGKSLWLTDHRALLHSGFSEIWCVTKTGKGSQVALVSNLEE